MSNGVREGGASRHTPGGSHLGEILGNQVLAFQPGSAMLNGASLEKGFAELAAKTPESQEPGRTPAHPQPRLGFR